MIKYVVKARLAKNIGTDNFTFESFEREFRNDENPISARKKAFQYYFSIIEIMGGGENDFKFIQENIDRAMEVIAKSPDEYDEFAHNYNDDEFNSLKTEIDLFINEIDSYIDKAINNKQFDLNQFFNEYYLSNK